MYRNIQNIFLLRTVLKKRRNNIYQQYYITEIESHTPAGISLHCKFRLLVSYVFVGGCAQCAQNAIYSY